MLVAGVKNIKQKTMKMAYLFIEESNGLGFIFYWSFQTSLSKVLQRAC